jgi:inorganic pyrophosphatase
LSAFEDAKKSPAEAQRRRRKMTSYPTHSLIELDAFDPESRLLNIVIDTPKGSRNKYSFDAKVGLFKLVNVLPVGAVFPFDFGFVPSTLGGDGDPLDVLLLLDEPTFTGCLVAGRVLGVIEARQRDGHTEWIRNDRLIAVADKSATHRDLTSLAQVSSELLDQIEHFFISYNQLKGTVFEPLDRFGREHAETVLREAVSRRER